MGHISGKIASIAFSRAASVEDLDFHVDKTGFFVRRRFMLTAAAQQSNCLLNTAFWPDNPPFHDPQHRKGVLSAVFLALAVAPLGRRIVSEAIRLAHVGPRPHHFGLHARNVLLGAPSSLRDVIKIVGDRFLATRRKPGFLIRSHNGKYALHYHAEQEPNPNSRIVLTDQTDDFGLPRVRIDLRYTDNDVRSVIGSHQILDSALRSDSTGRLEYWYGREQLFARVFEQASDGFHQMGTTRMGVDPTMSVVDANLKVHGTRNLHVASSSVFPTSGQANSTFLAVALAARLAQHLKSEAPTNHTVAAASAIEPDFRNQANEAYAGAPAAKQF
jgi:choline dehydrogenase-like flavoprotein